MQFIGKGNHAMLFHSATTIWKEPCINIATTPIGNFFIPAALLYPTALKSHSKFTNQGKSITENPIKHNAFRQKPTPFGPSAWLLFETNMDAIQ